MSRDNVGEERGGREKEREGEERDA